MKLTIPAYLPVVYLCFLLSSSYLHTVHAQPVSEDFPATRDAGINGFPGPAENAGECSEMREEFNNTGASPMVRGAKRNEHSTLFDFDSEAIERFLDANPGPFTAELRIFVEGTPDTNVGVQTVESTQDWAEGDAISACCDAFEWTEGTAAVTHVFAQTFYQIGEDGCPSVDLAASIPWTNDEDDSEYTLMNRSEDVVVGMPNHVNSADFELDAWLSPDWVDVRLDPEIIEEIVENPFNRGLQLRAPVSRTNWRATMREFERGDFAAHIRITVDRPIDPMFRRGDASTDGEVALDDGILVLNFLFLGGQLDCKNAADANDDGRLLLDDGVHILNYLFQGGPAPASPGPTECGQDDTPAVDLDCRVYASCA